MIFKGIFTSTPYIWAAITAFFFGAALSRATKSVRKTALTFNGDIDRARAVKWSLSSIYISLAIVSALCGTFIPGPSKIANINLLYFFSVLTVIFFLSMRFKKTIGLLTVIVLVLGIGSVFLFVHSLHAYTGETKIADIRVLDLNKDSMKIEIIESPSETEIVQLKGSYFAPIVKEVIFADYFVFLGAKTWYRFIGVTGFSFVKDKGVMTLKQTDRGFYFKRPEGISESIYKYFEKYEDSIPGVKTVQVDITAKKAVNLKVYSLFIQNDGGLQIVDTKK
ncbi:MAG: hypothetical protein J7K04_15010 [Spirochaetales bacterium]|nr:hypothetical protein [Spirochaetales bacterium]